MIGETGVTFLLILAILTTAAHPGTRRFTPLVLPAVLSVLVWLEAPISGAGANPARSFGPALVARVSMNSWIYLVDRFSEPSCMLASSVLRLFASHA